MASWARMPCWGGYVPAGIRTSAAPKTLRVAKERSVSPPKRSCKSATINPPLHKFARISLSWPKCSVPSFAQQSRAIILCYPNRATRDSQIYRFPELSSFSLPYP